MRGWGGNRDRTGWGYWRANPSRRRPSRHGHGHLLMYKLVERDAVNYELVRIERAIRAVRCGC